MGNFYVNFTVRSQDREEIGNRLVGRDVFISPALNGVVVIYDKEADMQYWPMIESLGQQLSDRLATAVLAVMNHDDDILAYALFDRGKETDSYNSAPDYFEEVANPRGPIGGDARALCEAFGSKNIDAVRPVLQKPGAEVDDGYVFAHDRHRDLMRALGFDQEAFFGGYNYLEAGEFPQGLSKDDFIEVGGKP